jgi:divinyl protochlorophyllide a 8-vinyl-reductase
MKSGHSSSSRGTPGRIGPNAVIQTVRALEERCGSAEAARMLAGRPARWLAERPSAMVDERDFRDLVEAIGAAMPADEASAVLYRSGRLTGEYVLANRIPRIAQTLIRALRRGPGPAILLRAIGANAGTFGESGSYAYTAGGTPRVQIANPVLSASPELAAAVCAYNRGAFEALFRGLIDAQASIVEEHCQATGGNTCTYRIERGRR